MYRPNADVAPRPVSLAQEPYASLTRRHASRQLTYASISPSTSCLWLSLFIAHLLPACCLVRCPWRGQPRLCRERSTGWSSALMSRAPDLVTLRAWNGGLLRSDPERHRRG